MFLVRLDDKFRRGVNNKRRGERKKEKKEKVTGIEMVSIGVDPRADFIEYRHAAFARS